MAEKALADSAASVVRDAGPKRVEDAIQWWLVAGSIVLVAVLHLLSGFNESRPLSVATSLVTLLLTFFVSYVVTRHYAQKAARAELFDLGQASGEQTLLLSQQLRELATEAEGFQPDDDRSELFIDSMISHLNKMASQAELSFHNIQRMAGLDISMPALRAVVQTAIEEGLRTERVPCPHCRCDNDVLVPASEGKTKATKCGDCRKPFTVHRLAEGKLKIMFPELRELRCPNPKCSNEILIRKKEDEWGTVVRNCFECFARIRYDLDEGKVEGFEVETPLVASEILGGRVRCPYCGNRAVLKGGPNSRGERLMSCPSCTKLMRVEEAPRAV